MKKTITIILIGGMTFLLGACGKEASPAQDWFSQVQEGETSPASRDAFGGEEELPDSTGTVSGGLQYLADSIGEGCCTEEGYYYLTHEEEKLSDGSYGFHLMYMDFASQKEVYLCSNAGCSHDTPDCQAVFLQDDFRAMTSMLFVFQDALWLLSKDSDDDGSVTISTAGEESFVSGPLEKRPPALYRMNLDGTMREKIYSFDAGVTLEDLVLGDEKGLYLVKKTLTSDQDGANTYITSKERSLVFLDPEEKKEQLVCSLEFGDFISWHIAGCSGEMLLLKGLDYGKEVTREEIWDDDSYKNLYENSQEVFASFSLEDFRLTEKYRMDNKYTNSAFFQGNLLYASTAADNSVRTVDFETGEEKILYQQPGEYYYLFDLIGDKIRCERSGDYNTFYYIDKNTGQMVHSSQVNKSLGWALEFKGVTETDVLVIYDYDATPSKFGGGAYEIHQYQYGLISQEDLFAGRDNYRRIDMVGKGE